MDSVPGLRTNPTVKSMANSNQRKLKSWQVTFGPIPLIVVLGIFVGCLPVAFYLGFFAGQKVGIEAALNNNLAAAMRLPMSSQGETQDLGEDVLSDVYAKLNDAGLDRKDSAIKVVRDNEPSNGRLAASKQAASAAQEIPEVGRIQTAHDLAQAALGQADAPSSDHAKPEAAARAGTVRVLGGGSVPGVDAERGQASMSGDTLGTIAQKARREEEEAASRREKETIAAAAGRAIEPEAIQVPGKPALSAAQPESKQVKEPSVTAPSKVQPLAESKTLVTKNIPRGWFAQIVAPRTQSEAEIIAGKLKASGFPVIVENAMVRGEEYFRVLVGPEDNRQQAERLLVQLKREPYVKGDPFIRMVR